MHFVLRCDCLFICYAFACIGGSQEETQNPQCYEENQKICSLKDLN